MLNRYMLAVLFVLGLSLSVHGQTLNPPFTLRIPAAPQETVNVCVEKSAQQVHESLINYVRYSAYDDNMVKEITIGGFTKTIHLMDMFLSNPEFSVKTQTKTQALVKVALQPLGQSDTKIYPRFILDCRSEFTTQKSFNHACVMLTENSVHFSLNAFESHVTVTEDDPTCLPGNSKVSYWLTLTTNPQDIYEIKKGTHLPMKLVDLLFDEQKFFKDYYENFYASWLKTLKN